MGLVEFGLGSFGPASSMFCSAPYLKTDQDPFHHELSFIYIFINLLSLPET